MREFTRRQWVGLIVLAALAAAAVFFRLMVDRDPLTRSIGFAWPAESYAAIRWTAIAVGTIVGAGLAVSGTILQTLLRNPLAEPFILGLSSGAGLGVMAAMYVSHVMHSAGADQSTYTVPAILGALGTLAVVYALGQRGGWLDPISLVLVGVIVSAVCGAGIMFFQHLVPTGLRGEFTLWLMGHLTESISRRSLIIASVVVAGGALIAVIMGRAMDVANLGDDEARSVGLEIGWLRLSLFILAGALAAVTVALAGPIGFVGLIAPHAARFVLGPRHTVLIIGAALAGITLIVGSDSARQALDFGAGRMPIGIFTALIGGPTFIWLLISGRGRV